MQQRSRRWFVSLAMALVLAYFIPPTGAEEGQPSGNRVAEVNDSVITQVDFDNEINRVQQMFLNRGTPLNDSQLSRIKQEVLENLINRELLYQESQDKGIDVDEAEVDGQLRALKNRFPSDAEFKEALSQVNLSEGAVKSQIRRDMAIRGLIDEEFASKITVSDVESKTYYDNHPALFRQPEQVRASHILIKVDPQANALQKAEARKKVEEIRAKLKKGEDFAVLARQFSQGPSSTRGGDLNYFRRGQMVGPFEDVAFSLKPGEVSDIVETRFGYHLIKVMDKKPQTTIPYADVKGKIEAHLKREKLQVETKKYVEKLKEGADVERFLQVEP